MKNLLCCLGLHRWQPVSLGFQGAQRQGVVVPQVHQCARCGVVRLKGVLCPGQAMPLLKHIEDRPEAAGRVT